MRRIALIVVILIVAIGAVGILLRLQAGDRALASSPQPLTRAGRPWRGACRDRRLVDEAKIPTAPIATMRMTTISAMRRMWDPET